jgi:signal transduction histidine kinase/PAS domain-containing protein
MTFLTEKFPQKGLKGKLIWVMLGVGIAPLLLATVISYTQGNKSLQGVIGASFKALAYETSTKIDLLIQREIKINRRFSTHPSLGLFIKEHNKRLEKFSPKDRKRHLEQNKSLWAKEETFAKELVQNSAARQLKKFFPHYEKVAASTIAVYLTGKYGVLVAAVNQNQPYLNSIFINHTNKGKAGTISDIYLDGVKGGQYIFQMSIPVKNSQGKVIGGFHRIYSAKNFFSPFIETILFGETGHVMLINSKGVVIDCPILPTGSRLPSILTKSVTGAQPSWATTEGNGHGSEEVSIIGYSPILTTGTTAKYFKNPPWFTFAWQSSEELFEPRDNLFIWICSSGFVSIFLILIMGSAAAEKIVKPIKILRRAAGRIGRGEMVEDITIRTGDEIEALCDEINAMNKMLQKSFSGLEREVELKAQEVLYIKDYTDSILMSIPDIVLIIRNNRRIEYVNSAIEGLIHLKKESLVGKTFEELDGGYRQVWKELEKEMGKISPNLSEENKKVWEVADNYEARDPLAPISKKDKVNPQPFVAFDERIFTYRFFNVGIRGEEGKRVGLLMREITGEKKLMDQLIMAEKLSGLGTLTAGIAHEMNNPLYSIMGFTEAIQEEPDINKVRKFAAKVLNSSQHMASVILNFSGYSRNKVEDQARDVDVNQCIEIAIDIARMASMTDGILFQKNFSNIKPIKAKPEEIQQVFVNIIKNSVQAMKGKGCLTISTDLREDSIEIIIQDTGPGIANEYLAKIFDPFFTTKSQGEGTGLGLNIVHRIMQKYAGKVNVDSVVDKGARFMVSFPLESIRDNKVIDVLD